MSFSREFPHSFGDALRVCREVLSANLDLVRKGLIDTEAEQIVIGAHRLATGEKMSRSQFYSDLQNRLPESTAERILVLAGRRAEGVPLQHVLGFQTFLNHEYEVDSSTLIPRPETEVLVRQALSELKAPLLGFEIGLGSGVISIELLCAFPELKMVATEISEGAIALAKRNAEKILGSAWSSRLETVKAEKSREVLESFISNGKRADFLISNPPYLDATSGAEVDAEVLAYEPKAALFPTGDPLHFYREIARAGDELLREGGQVFLEIAAERADATLSLFISQERWKARLWSDLAGRPRVLAAQKKAKGME